MNIQMNIQTLMSRATNCGCFDPELGWMVDTDIVNGWSGRMDDLWECEYDFLNTDGCVITDTPQFVSMKVRLHAVELETKVGHISQAMLDDLAQSLLKRDIVIELETRYSDAATGLTGYPSCVVFLEDFTYALERYELREGVFINEAGFDWETVCQVEPALV